MIVKKLTTLGVGIFLSVAAYGAVLSIEAKEDQETGAQMVVR